MAVAKLFTLGIAVVAAGTVLHIIGMATPHWTEFKILNNTVEYGLFENCENDNCTSDTKNERDVDRAVQAMAILGLISSVFGVAAALVFFFVAYCGSNPKRIFRLAGGIFSIFGFVFMVVCIVTYAGKIFEDFRDEPLARDTQLGYSFGLSSGGGALMFIGGLLILCTGGFEAEQYTNIS